MTNKEERPAGCVLRLFGAPEQTVQKAVEALPDTWQGTVHCRSRGAETLVALQSSTPQQLHRAVQLLRTSLAPALYGEGEQTLAAAAVQALEQHRKLLVCSDTAAGALLETRLENLPGAEKVFDFGAMSYANTAFTARLSRKLRKAPQAEPARTLARVQAMQNQVFIAMCNRVGTEGDMDFAGESLAIHPSGAVLKKADDTEQLLTCDIDLAEASSLRKKIPYLATRRPECYL